MNKRVRDPGHLHARAGGSWSTAMRTGSITTVPATSAAPKTLVVPVRTPTRNGSRYFERLVIAVQSVACSPARRAGRR